MSIAQALYSSDRQDHNTPPEVLERVRQLGRIVLDPCSNATSIVRATIELRLEQGRDGLKESWYELCGRELCFCNNPYDEGLAWAKKITREAEQGVEIIGLQPARTDTQWFQHIARRAQAICFWEGRLTFGSAIADTSQLAMFSSGAPQVKEATNTAPFPSFLPYFGPRPERFKAIFDPCGFTTVLR